MLVLRVTDDYFIDSYSCDYRYSLNEEPLFQLKKVIGSQTVNVLISNQKAVGHERKQMVT